MLRHLAPGFFLMVLQLASPPADADQTSALWGDPAAPTWDPATSRLPDFTHVGYMQGAVPIPDWPVAHSVTDYGAIPDDGIDDSQAFIDAIAACPDHHAVLVPRGQFTILRKIEVTNNYVCLRGEDMYGSVIFFPKYYGEVYINEAGFDSGSTPVYDFFFNLTGGTGKGVENLTFQFREQRNKGAWEYEGANAISYNGGVTDSWLRNVVILNYSSGLQIAAIRSSFINIRFDQFNGRCGTDAVSTQNLDAYGSVLVRNCSYNLFHNIAVEGGVLQPIDLNEASHHNVYSQYTSGERINRCIGYHGGSSRYNLYTDLDKGISRPAPGDGRSDETYWNVNDNYLYTSVWEDAYNATNGLIFVGYGDDWPSKTDDPTLWYEPADYGQITPNNLYLAQLNHFGKPLPEAIPGPAPSPYMEDVFGAVPDDDIKVDNVWYYKFDLSGANLPAVAHARLRVHMDNRHVSNPPYRFRAWAVTDDAWSEDTMTTANKPALVSELDSRWFEHADDDRKLEFDVTSFVQAQLVGGDGVVSLALDITDLAGLPPVLWFAETGTKPELIIERVADPIPGPPSAPRNIGTTPLIGNILLDWEDHPEAGVTYTVYRNPYKVGADGTYTEGYGEYIDNGLVTSDIADIQSAMNWRAGQMYDGVVYRYKIAAVDDHGYESPRSVEIYAATLHPSNDPPTFAQTVTLSNATAWEDYSESLAGNASDPESDPLYFHIVSGPEWLNVTSDGVLSGMPQTGDAGSHAVTFQVTAIGGSTQKTVNLVVDLPVDDPPGAPAAPTGFSATATDSSVSLVWNDNAESDVVSYSIYRSTVSNNYSDALAIELGSSEFVDDAVVNGITYYYVVTAVDKNGNESAVSFERTASPVADTTPPSTPTGFNAMLDVGAVRLTWNANTESDFESYSVYRSTTPNDYSAALITGLTTPIYTDADVVDGTTYYYLVTSKDIYNNESTGSTEEAITFDASAFNALVTGDFTVASNWSEGVLPTDPLDPGIIHAGSTDATWANNPASGLSIRQTGGVVSRSSFAWQSFSAMNYEILDGTFTAGSWGLELKNGSTFTMGGGTVTVGDSLNLNASSFTMTGGTLSARQLRANGGASYDFSGGSVNVNGGAGAFASSSGTSAINFSGDIDFNANILGVSGTQNIAIGAGTGTIKVDTLDVANLSINWIPGSAFTIAVASLLDSGAATTWADIWNSGKMTYNGAGLAALGSWAAVTTPRGLDGVLSFSYDNATQTLFLLGAVPPPNPEYTDAELWRLLHFEQSENSGIAADDFDFDQDGLSNLLERAFNTSPIDSTDWVAMPGAGLIRQGETDHLSITYRQLLGGTGATGIDYKANGITYTVEHDADLAGSWNMGSVVPVDDPVNNGDGTETVTVRLMEDVTNRSAHFMRLKISADP